MKSLALLISFLVLLVAESILASPILFDKLFGFAAYQPTYGGAGYGAGGGYGGNSYGYYPVSGGGGIAAPTQKARKPKTGRSYKEICRVINPTPYALPGSIPAAGAPFCPY
ncbi:uncharacterized protein LOC129738970 [Uranotaenia lowii]|uniref:uncharacterized protein LOC129738970 n=1 Tax=Uranotaenia lowii TaxID=190385 RepID=UPI00247A9158|nr:uncharacterized protein LOC129738970 [Uranotaenia lowii]